MDPIIEKENTDTKTQTSSKKILLIEDDSFLNSLISAKLIKQGFDVVSVFNGKDAMTNLGQGKFDLILLDIILPDFNGLDLLKDIKSRSTITPPVIILSNLSQEAESAKSRELGAIDYMVKASYTPEEIVKKIEGLLG